MKHRPQKAVRPAPIPPGLVALLRWQVRLTASHRTTDRSAVSRVLDESVALRPSLPHMDWSAPESGCDRMGKTGYIDAADSKNDERVRDQHCYWSQTLSIMWRRQDSNLGRRSRQIYSLLPLAARAHRRGLPPQDRFSAVPLGNDVNDT